MSWMSDHSLAHRIAGQSVPLVLCGPMLRRVEPTSVSVFVALKHAREVTLEVFEGLSQPRPLRMRGTGRTIQLGEYLHVAVVMATAVAEEVPLTGGRLYFYNLRFAPTSGGGTGPGLADLDLLRGAGRLGFQDDELPSFALPPDDLERLRLIHASCRKPHGQSLDALEGLAMMTASTWRDPLGRPHQLFLSGDQIYADDVADSLLLMVMDAADTLLGWSELGVRRHSDGAFAREGYTVTPTRLAGPAIPVEDVLPGHRSRTARVHCGFTVHPVQDDKVGIDRSHLLCFGEYAAMYLFAWSPALWPVVHPGLEDIYPEQPERVPLPNKWVSDRVKRSTLAQHVSKQDTALCGFRSRLNEVRRALANVPTYMMFDDHEITDDWFLNRRWCQQVLGSPLGPWAIQNGLAAFAIFQAWGNLPARFTSGLPGGHLLARLAQWSELERRIAAGEPGLDTDAQAARSEVNERVGIGPDLLQQIETHRHLPHPAGTIPWHYRVTGPGYEVLVLDTRTWRSYPGREAAFAALISDQGLQAQISQGGESQAEVTLVVSPVPVIGVPLVESIQETGSISAKWRFRLDAEAWGLQLRAFEQLLSTLARRLPRTGGGKRRGYVVLLSGDVHYGFAARFHYWAVSPFEPGKPFESPTTQECEMIAVQFTASALKNEEGKTRTLHNRGYRPLSYSLPRSQVAGWNNQGGEMRVVGWWSPDRKQPILARGNPARADLDTESFHFGTRPHWKYRVDYLLAETEVSGPAGSVRDFNPRFVTVPPPDPQSRAARREALGAYLAMSGNHEDYLRRWGNGKEVVGVNNLGEISFVWNSQGERAAVQDLWWRLRQAGSTDQLLPTFPLTTHVASLRYNDPRYPEPHPEANP